MLGQIGAIRRNNRSFWAGQNMHALAARAPEIGKMHKDLLQQCFHKSNVVALVLVSSLSTPGIKAGSASNKIPAEEISFSLYEAGLAVPSHMVYGLLLNAPQQRERWPMLHKKIADIDSFPKETQKALNERYTISVTDDQGTPVYCLIPHIRMMNYQAGPASEAQYNPRFAVLSQAGPEAGVLSGKRPGIAEAFEMTSEDVRWISAVPDSNPCDESILDRVLARLQRVEQTPSGYKACLARLRVDPVLKTVNDAADEVGQPLRAMSFEPFGV